MTTMSLGIVRTPRWTARASLTRHNVGSSTIHSTYYYCHLIRQKEDGHCGQACGQAQLSPNVYARHEIPTRENQR